jgi:hypothetical protein
MTATLSTVVHRAPPVVVPHDVIAKLGDQLAEMVERGSDRLAEGYAGLKAISAVTGNPDHGAAADAIGSYLSMVLAAEIARPDPIPVPASIIEALRPFSTDVPTTIDMPQVLPGTFADGVRVGRKNALLLEQSRKVQGRPARRKGTRR